jgi:purine-binding chemotaxis protein CheW
MSEADKNAKPLRELLVEAATHGEAASADPDLELFCLQMNGERFALEASLVHEVVRLPPLTPLPGMPNFLLGVCAHRGEVLPVVDLAKLMGRGETKTHNRSRMAVTRVDGMVVALLTDLVEGLTRLPASLIESAPVGATQRGAEFLAGVSSDPLGTFSVLDLRRLVAAARSRAVGQ